MGNFGPLCINNIQKFRRQYNPFFIFFFCREVLAVLRGGRVCEYSNKSWTERRVASARLTSGIGDYWRNSIAAPLRLSPLILGLGIQSIAYEKLFFFNARSPCRSGHALKRRK